VKLSLLEVVLNQFAAANCFMVIMWYSCDMILQSSRVSNLLDVVRFTSVNLLL